jgi:hypothetical protein
VGQAAIAVLPNQRKEWIEERCHRLKHEDGAAKQLLGEMKKLPIGRSRKQEKEELKSAVTYFTNHKEKMHYARWQREGLPIGSGVTEAACKTLIKQRLCNAGMRWKDKGASAVISLRSLVITDVTLGAVLGQGQPLWRASGGLSLDIKRRSHPAYPASSSQF